MDKVKDPELNSFLSKVDEINDIMTQLTSEDSSLQKEALKKADEFVEKQENKKQRSDHTGVNRSVINQEAFNDLKKPDTSLPQDQTSMNQEAFMAAMEQDSQDRYERRQKQKEKAFEIKDKGNEKFKMGDFKGAVDLYSQALSEFKDTTVLWTNRAQAYNKLGEYNKALSDCDWALRVFENCVKAYIQRGKAYLGLKQYDDAIGAYKKVLTIEPEKNKAIQGFIAEVELARKSESEEIAATKLFNEGDTHAKGVVELLAKLEKQNHPPLFYSGGLRTLEEVLKGVNEQTLYRTNNGFDLTVTHTQISRSFSKDPKKLAIQEVDMLCSLFDVYRKAVINNDESMRRLLHTDGFGDGIMQLLSVRADKLISVHLSCVYLLHVVSESELGRQTIYDTVPCDRLTVTLLELMDQGNKLAAKAVGVLNNLVLNNKYRGTLESQVELLLSTFHKIMKRTGNDSAVLPCCLSTLMNLCGSPTLRRKLQQHDAMWSIAYHLLEESMQKKNNTMLHSVLGLFINLTYDNSAHITTYAQWLCERSADIIAATTSGQWSSEVITRAWTLIGHLVSYSTSAVDTVSRRGLVKVMAQSIKEKCDDTKLLLKCLTACSQCSESVCTALVSDKGMDMLWPLLEHNDETVIGNSALCLTYCLDYLYTTNTTTLTSVSDGAVHRITTAALSKARDCHNTSAQHNCAILIAKLTRTDGRFLDKLRELDGLGILHHVLKK